MVGRNGRRGVRGRKKGEEGKRERDIQLRHALEVAAAAVGSLVGFCVGLAGAEGAVIPFWLAVLIPVVLVGTIGTGIGLIAPR